MDAIVAVYADWGIGDGGTQPVVLKADRAHFRELTKGAAVIVGRRTLGDFPGGKPLKGRDNLVVTRQNIEIPGARVVHSTEEALAAAAEYERCLVIGGASIYRQFFPHITRRGSRLGLHGERPLAGGGRPALSVLHLRENSECGMRNAEF